MVAEKVTNGSIDSDQMANNSVIGSKIAPNSISSSHLNSSAITSAKLAPNSVTTDKIAPNAITSAKLANNSVGSDQLQSAITLGQGGVTIDAGERREFAGTKVVDELVASVGDGATGKERGVAVVVEFGDESLAPVRLAVGG